MNNFDQSKSGINVSVRIYYDKELSQLDFNENFIPLENHFFLYTRYGELVSPSCENLCKHVRKITDLIYETVSNRKMNVAKKRLEKFGISDEIEEECKNNPYDKRYIIFDYLQNYLEPEQYYDIVDREFDFSIVTVTGYSQGDYAKVLIPKEFKDTPTEFLQRLIFDTPISVDININDKEYSGYDYGIDEYDEDIDSIKDKLTKGLKKDLTEKEFAEFVKVLEQIDEISY